MVTEWSHLQLVIGQTSSPDILGNIQEQNLSRNHMHLLLQLSNLMFFISIVQYHQHWTMWHTATTTMSISDVVMLTMDHLISWQWISKTNCKSMNVLVPPLPPRFLPIRPPSAAHEEALETESDSKLCWPWQHKERSAWDSGQVWHRGVRIREEHLPTNSGELGHKVLKMRQKWGRDQAWVREEGATPSLRVTSCCCCFTHPAPTRDDFTDPTEAGPMVIHRGKQWSPMNSYSPKK